MAHHKRRRPKDRRAGCLMCKPNKSHTVKRRGEVGRGWAGCHRTWKQEWFGWLNEQEQKRDEGL